MTKQEKECPRCQQTMVVTINNEGQCHIDDSIVTTNGICCSKCGEVMIPLDEKVCIIRAAIDFTIHRVRERI